MASLAEIQALVQAIKDELPGLINKSQIAPKQVVIVNGLSDVSEKLGLVMAGEFRSGNGKEPGFGFSGVRIGYPAFSYAGSTYNIAGVNNDTLQVGINATDGKLYAGGGNVTIGADGIRIGNLSSSLLAFARSDGQYGYTSIGTSTTTNAISIYQNTVNAAINLWTTLADGSKVGLQTYGDPIQSNRSFSIFASGGEGARVLFGSGGQFDFRVAGNTVEGTFMRMMQSPRTPTVPGWNDAVHVYLKSNKIIFQYTDAGTTRYKYLDLSGTGVTWVHTTAAP